MIRFLKVILRNFMSYGNNDTIFDFTLPGTTLILGSNGVGKTTIMNALVYALYNKSISKVNVDELINRINKKDMGVVVEFEKDGHTYQIIRVRKGRRVNGKDTWVQLNIDGKESTPSNIEEKIQEIIGMPHDMFVRVVVISALHDPFLEMDSPKQTAFVENLFNLTMFSEKAKILNSLMKTTNQTITIEQAKIDQVEKNKKRHEEQVNSARTRVVTWEQNNQKSIRNIEIALESIAGVDFQKEKDLHTRLKEVNDALTQVLREQRVLKSAVDEYNKNKVKLEKEIKLLQDKKCPFCLQEYKESKDKVAEHEVKLNETQQELNLLLEDLKKVDESIPAYTEERTTIEGSIEVQNLDRLLEIKNESQILSNKLADLKQATNPHIEALEELETAVLDQVDYTEINKFTRKLEHQQFLYKLLTKKDSFIRKAFIGNVLPFLNKRLKKYLEFMELPFKVEFTSELSTTITQFGSDASFASLSNGQQARVNLGLALAFRDVQTTLHPPVNICLLDEVFDLGLDDEGVELATKILKNKAREENINLFIISHRGLSTTLFNNAFKVTLDKGFAVINPA